MEKGERGEKRKSEREKERMREREKERKGEREKERKREREIDRGAMSLEKEERKKRTLQWECIFKGRGLILKDLI